MVNWPQNLRLVVLLFGVITLVHTSRVVVGFSSSSISSRISSQAAGTSTSPRWSSSNLIIRHASETSALSETSEPTTSTNPQSSSSMRVFVGGLTTRDPTILKKDLEDRYGPIEGVFVMKETTARPYAFVDFTEEKDAQQAINESSSSNNNSLLYQNLEAANPADPQSRQKCSRRDQKAQQDFEASLQLAQTSTTIIQVHQSHVNRTQKLLESNSDANDDNQEPLAFVTGSCKLTACRSVALLGAKGNNNNNANDIQQFFQSLPYPLRGVNKLYSVDPSKLLVGGTQVDALDRCIQEMTTIVNDGDDDEQVKWKLNVFPPKLFFDLLLYIKEHDPALLARLSPTQSTHTFHLVSIPAADDGNDKNSDKNLWLMDVVANSKVVAKQSDPAKLEVAEQNQAMSNRYNAGVICRAQSKLQEAFFRYTAGPLPDCFVSFDDSSRNTDKNTGGGGIAVDCGAAPGGWTQYMVEHCHLGSIYSIDPGDLDPIVAQHSNVVHMRSKIEDALAPIQNILAENHEEQQQQQRVKLWVSDMCLHQMSDQVDTFLKAQRMGVVGEGTFFVLTLKCKVGHSDDAFDGQVAVQLKRLEESCRNLQAIHLFSNRSGERTIMGYATSNTNIADDDLRIVEETTKEASEGGTPSATNLQSTDSKANSTQTRRGYLQFVTRMAMASFVLSPRLAAAAGNNIGQEVVNAIPTECQNGALMTESAVPGAYDQVCMNLPLRTIPVHLPSNNKGRSKQPMDLQIQQEGVGPGKTGLAVWNSALLLGRLLEALVATNPSYLQDKQLAELGCGTGLVSLMASYLGAKSIWATDGNPAAVALTQVNFERNNIAYTTTVSSPAGTINENSNDNVVTAMQWGELQVPLEWMGKADILVGSDLTYNSGSWRVLAETMESLLSKDGIVLYLSLGHADFNVRGEVDGFINVAKEVGLSVKPTSALPFFLPSGESNLETLLQKVVLPSEQPILGATGGAQVLVLGRK